MEPNPDILQAVASRPSPPFCVGFAAESENLEEHAAQKRRKKGIPLLAANLAQEAIDSEDNELVLIDDGGIQRLKKSPKIDQARTLINHMAKLYRSAQATVSARDGRKVLASR